jgi:hypothetical protein
MFDYPVIVFTQCRRAAMNLFYPASEAAVRLCRRRANPCRSKRALRLAQQEYRKAVSGYSDLIEGARIFTAAGAGI